MTDLMVHYFPEVSAGGFSRVDGTVNFYQRINALVRTDSTVVDFGAGRGAFLEDPVAYRRDLRLLKGRVRQVIGVDVDKAVMSNPALDRAYIVTPGDKISIMEESVDLVVSDFVFEHVAEPAATAAELTRILKPGGWLCARTPNKWGIIGIAARLTPNRWHVPALRRLQPHKREIDTFPTLYRLNDMAALNRYFPAASFENYSYWFDGDPSYVANSRVAWKTWLAISAVMPERGRSIFGIFLRKRI